MIVPRLRLLKVSVVPAADPGLVAQTRHLLVLPGVTPDNADRGHRKLAVSDRANPAQAAHPRAAHLKVGNAVPVVPIVVDRHSADRRRIPLALLIMSSSSMPTATA